MELKWLEDFLSLSRTRSFSRTATERFCTQSALSRRIKALELWVGTTLVDRSVYPTALTQAGLAFRDTAEEVTRQLLEVRDDLRGRLQTGSDAVTIAALHALTVDCFPRWLQACQQRIGPFDVRLVPDNLHDCVRALNEGSCDLMLSYAHASFAVLLDPRLFPSILLMTERFLPVSRPDADGRALFALPGKRREPLPYLAYGPATMLGQAADFVLKRQQQEGVHLRCCYENPMAEGLKPLVKAGHGIAWMPSGLIERELARGELVPAGDAGWELELETRLYRRADVGKPRVLQAWSALGDGLPA
ncbi:LysR family transcriptional regulator [Variovorax sp. PvP013]|jgi:DNA-binding transcriptional LysR family regulator|uniref:LysR family transcriptional regulator n=1 Tax=Variovorax sp. PvP013 TaxID=3156435 RepID=UPI003D1DA419